MKKTNIIYLLLLVLCWGCDDFLEESSQNLMRPGSVNHLEELLIGDGYGDEDGGIPYLMFWFTDEIKCDHTPPRHSQNLAIQQYVEYCKKYTPLYSFDPNMFQFKSYGYYDGFWGTFYRRILGCNIVLDFIDEMTNTNDVEDVRKGNALKGEALALRAWCYLHLVNMYGIAYNQGNPETDLAVPLVRTSQFEFAIPRNTVKEVYESIEQDLLQAIELMEANLVRKSNFRIQANAAKAMLARAYLYQERWDDAIQYSKAVIEEKPDLKDYSQLTIAPRGRYTSTESGVPDWLHSALHPTCQAYDYQNLESMEEYSPYHLPYSQSEVLWSRKCNIPGELRVGNYQFIYLISDELSAVYGENSSALDYVGGSETIKDLRGMIYFQWTQYGTDLCYFDCRHEYRRTFQKGGMESSLEENNYQGIRVAELYLNLAEAYAQKFVNGGTTNDRDLAIQYLNALREKRFYHTVWEEEGKVEAADFTNAQALLAFCIDERWRELCGETNHRYCDLRRYGKTVKHEDNFTGEGSWQQEMSRFVLPISQYVLKNDLSIQPN